MDPRASREDLVVLDRGEEDTVSTKSLAEAARAERERRAKAGPPVAVITDKNLKQYAKGQLTVATPGKEAKGSAEPPRAGEAAAGAEEGAADRETVRDESYWRRRAQALRQRWRDAADETWDLERSAAGWRRRFYAENDPYVRDGQIKPEWDRVLDRLEEARVESERARQELSDFLEEGRLAGALPGWLREGVDLEPGERPEPSNQHQVVEPPVAGEDGR